jgi:hypothetical protein
VRLEREGAVERQQRPVAVAQAVRRQPQLVPRQRQVGVVLESLLERPECLGIAAQVDEGRPAQRLRERPGAEPLRRCLGQSQRVRRAAVPAASSSTRPSIAKSGWRSSTRRYAASASFMRPSRASQRARAMRRSVGASGKRLKDAVFRMSFESTGVARAG